MDVTGVAHSFQNAEKHCGGAQLGNSSRWLCGPIYKKFGRNSHIHVNRDGYNCIHICSPNKNVALVILWIVFFVSRNRTFRLQGASSPHFTMCQSDQARLLVSGL